jgi:hypothetical protein
LVKINGHSNSFSKDPLSLERVTEEAVLSASPLRYVGIVLVLDSIARILALKLTAFFFEISIVDVVGAHPRTWRR